MSKHVPTPRFHLAPALHFAAGAVFMVANAACVAGDVDRQDDASPSWAAELGELDRSPVTTAGDQWNSCPTWDCGKNHALVNTFAIPELHEGGKTSPQGMRIMGVTRQGVGLDLQVEGGVMTGASGTNTYTDHDMIGSIMMVSDGVDTWEIMIADYTKRLLYWAGPGAISGYHLIYHRVGAPSGWENLCKEPLTPADAVMWPDQYEAYAVLIDDERYDTKAITVSDAPAEGWFNIACAGSALSKMMLMHYDPHLPANDAYYSTPTERTAVLKMLTADYLGIGEAFTKGGTLLQWEDTTGLHPHPQPAPVVEAVWDETGALCLDWPRLAIADIDIFGKIESMCDGDCVMPPTCADAGITADNWAQHGLWRTYNPWW